MDTERRLLLAAMAHYIRSDLQSVDTILRKHTDLSDWLTAVKSANVALANILDLEPQTRLLYAGREKTRDFNAVLP